MMSISTVSKKSGSNDSSLRQQKHDSLAVFYSDHDQKCAECNRNIVKKSLIFDIPEKGAICLSCAGLDGLVILPSGNTALTVRSKKYSKISAVILKYSKPRKRYERQGILVEEKALKQATLDCQADAQKRETARAKAATRRVKQDEEYLARFAERVRALFPFCPKRREIEIASHACTKYSGRVGRTADAKSLDEKAVRLAVIAHIRHTETDYDGLLSNAHPKKDARQMIRKSVEDILSLWEHGEFSMNG